VAIAETRLDAEREAANRLRQRIEQDPSLLKDMSVLKEVRKLIERPTTAPAALAALAAAPGPVGPDFLYELWRKAPVRSDVSELGRALLYGRELKAKASPALQVVLALRTASSCEQYRDILPEAFAHGDRRALPFLQKLNQKQGCGANKRADCYTCLREGEELETAMTAVKTRREPKLSF
jgi:hypothetical protein